jgi:hypothetical protein
MRATIYVAGGSSEAREVAEYIRRLKDKGIEVTYDWTLDVIAAGIQPGETAEGKTLTVDQQKAIARLELTAVRVAQIFWLIVPRKKSEGSAVELGAALTYNTYSIISGDYSRNLFCQLGDFKFENHENAFDFIVELTEKTPQKIGV